MPIVVGRSTRRMCPIPAHSAQLLELLQVVWGKPPRPEWGQPLEITPRTVHAMSVTVSLRLLCAIWQLQLSDA